MDQPSGVSERTHFEFEAATVIPRKKQDSIRDRILCYRKAENQPGAVKSFFKTVVKIYRTSYVTSPAITVSVGLLTVAFEQVITAAAFTCPCPVDSTTFAGLRKNQVNGWVFIFGPALGLFILGYTMNLRTWKFVTGCCWRGKGADASLGCCERCEEVTTICLRASTSSVAWIVIAFLDGSFYACATTDSPNERCGSDSSGRDTTRSALYLENKQFSATIAWVIIGVMSIIATIAFTIQRCCSPLSYRQRKYVLLYRDAHEEHFRKEARELVEEKAGKEGTVENFVMENEKRSDEDILKIIASGRNMEETQVDERDDAIAGTSIGYGHGQLPGVNRDQANGGRGGARWERGEVDRMRLPPLPPKRDQSLHWYNDTGI